MVHLSKVTYISVHRTRDVEATTKKVCMTNTFLVTQTEQTCYFPRFIVHLRSRLPSFLNLQDLRLKVYINIMLNVTSTIWSCLDSRLIDGGKVVSLTHRRRSTPQKHYFSAPCTYFCKRLSTPQGLVRLEGLDKFKKFNILAGSRARDLIIL
jgi:hypothetical protein